MKKWLKKSTNYPKEPSCEILEIIPSPSTHSKIEMSFDEFTSLCPITGQPDFARLKISYIPDEYCVESKSIKIYLFSYRNFGCFGEAIADRIYCDLTTVLKPITLTVIMDFAPRGGIPIHIEVGLL